jgi:hypothetical protein
VHPHQLSSHTSFDMPIFSASVSCIYIVHLVVMIDGGQNPSIHSSSSISHSVEMFVPMNIPQYNRDGSSTVMFQVNTERNSLSIPLEECLQPAGGPHLKNAQEIMFPTVDRTQVQTFKLVIAVSAHTLNRLRNLSLVSVARIRHSGVPYRPRDEWSAHHKGWSRASNRVSCSRVFHRMWT